MKYAHFTISILLGGAALIGCAKITDDDPQAATTTTATTSATATTTATSTAATTTDTSESVTSAPGSTSTTDGTTSGTATSMPTSDGTTDGSTTSMATSVATTGADTMNVMEGCDTWTQDCPDGQKCTYYADDGVPNAVQCVEVTGTDKPGDECLAQDAANGLDSCIEGAICWGVDMNGAGTCVALCSGSPEAPVCDPPVMCTFTRLYALCLPG